MSRPDLDLNEIIPAHLDFLTIFSPDLGQTEDTEKDQIVFYWAKPTKGRRRRKQQEAEQPAKKADEDEHERMRQIGLAQGMVHFARTFGGGQDIDAIETERHRIVLKQLEQGWWILASICLTRIPAHLTSSGLSQSSTDVPTFDYSAREVSPPILLLEQLLRAHRIFLLHHAQSLSDIYLRTRRTRFCGILEKYWTFFAKGWDVLLHGNPVVDVYTGVKLPAAGELGIGVGEEDWGSGEREALEGLVRDTEGLVDLMVYRSDLQHRNIDPDPGGAFDARLWHANNLARGIVFTGLGNVTHSSKVTISEWMQHIAEQSIVAYGIQDNPTSTRSRLVSSKVKLPSESTIGESTLDEQQASPQSPATPKPAIPPSIMSVIENSLDKATVSAEATKVPEQQSTDQQKGILSEGKKRLSSQDWGKLLKFGYGTAWGPSAEAQLQEAGGKESDRRPANSHKTAALGDTTNGEFLVGLTGRLAQPKETPAEAEDDEDGAGNRVSVRTLQVEVPADDHTSHSRRESLAPPRQHSQSRSPSPTSSHVHNIRRLRVVVYKHDPFLWVFLFDPTTPSLSMASFYQTLHKQLEALHGPLEASTSPTRTRERLLSTLPNRNDDAPIYDLMFESTNMSVKTSIPGVPPALNDPSEIHVQRGPWTRLEALNVHTQTLASIAEARSNGRLREISAKTQRDWWILWMQQKMQLDDHEEQPDLQIDLNSPSANQPHREAILIRKSAEENSSQGHRRVSSNFAHLSLSSSPQPFGLGRFIGRDGSNDNPGTEGSDAGSSWSSSAGKVAEGIGIDPRKYMESLFNLNR